MACGIVMDQSQTQVVELAVNLDDIAAQIIGDAQRRLLDAGALDVWTTAIGMKKQRPGVMLCALAAKADEQRIAELMIRLTGSFGVRSRDWRRVVLDRRHETVATPFGDCRIKVGSLRGEVIVVRPEFEDVRALADSTGASVRTVMDAAAAAAAQWKAQHA